MIQLDHSLKRISETKIEFKYKVFTFFITKIINSTDVKTLDTGGD